MAKRPAPEREPLPDPEPIPRVRTQRIDFRDVVLLCPRCGHHSLEYLGVLTFERESERSTHFVRVQHSIAMEHSLPQAAPGDPHQRYHGAAIEYGCNSCVSYLDGLDHDGLGHGIWLETVNINGVCSLAWEYDPLPEGWGGDRVVVPDEQT